MRFAILLVLQTLFSFSYAQTTTTPAPAEAQQENWSSRVTVSGDIRLRHEYIDREERDRSNHRERIRARVKFEGQVEENLKAVLQLASGVGEAVSTNQTLDEGYTEKDIYISQAYLQWSVNNSLEVLGGKVKNTLYVPGESEIIFDPDLAPEGVTANYKLKFDSGSSLFANGGVYWYDERDTSATNESGSDTNQYSAQLGLNLALGDNVLTVGAGHHAFSPIEDTGVLGTGGAGNTVTTTGPVDTYDNGYAVSEAFLAYAMKTGLTIYANYAMNGEVSDEDTAYQAGVVYGKTKSAGDWSVGYSYRATEKDAVLGAIKDSDFANGETDSRGHRLAARYQVGSATVVGLTYFMNERQVSTTPVDYDRAQLDVVATF